MCSRGVQISWVPSHHIRQPARPPFTTEGTFQPFQPLLFEPRECCALTRRCVVSQTHQACTTPPPLACSILCGVDLCVHVACVHMTVCMCHGISVPAGHRHDLGGLYWGSHCASPGCVMLQEVCAPSCVERCYWAVCTTQQPCHNTPPGGSPHPPTHPSPRHGCVFLLVGPMLQHNVFIR